VEPTGKGSFKEKSRHPLLRQQKEKKKLNPGLQKHPLKTF